MAFSKAFPDGTPTNFEEKIQSGTKIHSIRSSYRWRAGMSIHMATGVRTKEYNMFSCRHVVCAQYINIYPAERQVRVDFAKWLSQEEIETLAKNDGLTTEQFWEWFSEPFSGKIIHWTTYKYE